MDAYGLRSEDLAPFAITAHDNGRENPNALLRRSVDIQGYLDSRMLNDPLRLMDAPPVCDGAAAVLLASESAVAEIESRRPRVRVSASAVATDTVSIDGRIETLRFAAAEKSTRDALGQSRMSLDDIDLFELHDAFTVVTALSLEAAGFAAPGRAVDLGQDGALALDGRLPISTMGGLKSRGHPVGATGVYQIVEAAQQLSGTAPVNQIDGAEVAMTQNIGGSGATVITHVLTSA